MYYLLSDQAVDKYAQAVTMGVNLSTPAEFKEEVDVDKSGSIVINGGLSAYQDPLLALFGSSTASYAGIMNRIAEMEADDSVNEIKLKFDSPGGVAHPLMLDCMRAIRNCSKKTTAIVDSACSAAYGLASQCNEIVLSNELSSVGSIGVKLSAFASDDVVTITNKNSKDKAPDLSTEEGKEIVEAELDTLYEVFVNEIALGRGVEPSKVKEDFGKGRTLYAQDAIKIGLADKMAVDNTVKTSKTNSTKEGITMSNDAQVSIDALSKSLASRVKAHREAAEMVGTKEALMHALTSVEKAVSNINEPVDMTEMMAYHTMQLKTMQAEARADQEIGDITPKTSPEAAKAAVDDNADLSPEEIEANADVQAHGIIL